MKIMKGNVLIFFGYDVDSILLQYSMVSKNTVVEQTDVTYDLRKSEIIEEKEETKNSSTIDI